MLLAVGLLLPSGVAAAEEEVPQIMAFQTKASDGWTFEVLAGAAPEGAEPDQGWTGIYLVRGKSEEVTYAAPATVTEKSIDADLGSLGKIEVTRVPTGRMRTVRTGCEPVGKERVGVDRFEGTIEFHGEEGFTELDADSAPGDSASLCGDDESGSAGKGLPGARLAAEKEHLENFRVDFQAVENRPGARTSVSAEIEEQRGPIEIHRSVGRWAPAATLRWDHHLRHATVEPPAPFSGHASFADGHGVRGIGHWAGNLSVDFPGHAGVPLSGSGFHASLSHPHPWHRDR
jgi:hypothetical protein